MTRGTITLVFDDGYERIYQNVVPLLRHYNMPAVFAVPLNTQELEKTEQQKVRPYTQWLHLKNEGHEIAAHSINHSNLTKLSDEELLRQLKEPATALQATTLVYPGGAFDARVLQAAARHYTAARTVVRGFETVSPAQPLQLKSYNFTRHNFSVFKADLLALWACLTNSWLIETYHMVDDNEQKMIHNVRTQEFSQHLQFINKLPVSVRTIKDVINSHTKP